MEASAASPGDRKERLDDIAYRVVSTVGTLSRKHLASFLESITRIMIGAGKITDFNQLFFERVTDNCDPCHRYCPAFPPSIITTSNDRFSVSDTATGCSDQKSLFGSRHQDAGPPLGEIP